jgi:uncharacterized membrane protein
MNVARLLRHLVFPPWLVRRAFSRTVLDRIEAAVGEAERSHSGEIRFAIEAALDWPALWRGQTSRDRAVDIFSRLRVWDTADNTGVLVYVLMADRAVEIVADRGIHAKVGQAAWEAVCGEMEKAFQQGSFESGALQGIRAIAVLLTRNFPATAANPNELPNRPVVL